MDFFLPTVTQVKAGCLALLGLAWYMYKKEALDWVKAFLKKCFSFLKRIFQPAPARRLMESEFQAILDSGLEGMEPYLWLVLKEYGADRVTVFEYEEQPDSGAFATCLVEVLNFEMKSVRKLQRTPLPPPLWSEIKAIGLHYPGRVRYVPDARIEENAAVRAALLSSSVCTAYYAMMLDPEHSYSKCQLLALSWRDEHPLSDAQLLALRSTAVACSMVLSLMGKLKKTSKD